MDAFLKLSDMTGESQDAAHSGEFDLTDFAFGVSQQGTMAISGGGGDKKAHFSDVQLRTVMGKHSPELYLRCATGKHFAEVVITVRKAGDDPLDWYKVTINDAIISSYQPSLHGAPAEESWSLNFAKMKVEYQAQKVDGSGEGFVGKGYDLKANAPF